LPTTLPKGALLQWGEGLWGNSLRVVGWKAPGIFREGSEAFMISDLKRVVTAIAKVHAGISVMSVKIVNYRKLKKKWLQWLHTFSFLFRNFLLGTDRPLSAPTGASTAKVRNLNHEKGS